MLGLQGILEIPELPLRLVGDQRPTQFSPGTDHCLMADYGRPNRACQTCGRYFRPEVHWANGCVSLASDPFDPYAVTVGDHIADSAAIDDRGYFHG